MRFCIAAETTYLRKTQLNEINILYTFIKKPCSMDVAENVSVELELQES